MPRIVNLRKQLRRFFEMTEIGQHSCDLTQQ